MTKRRIPLWLTTIPLLAGIALYALLWRGWAHDFEAEIGRWLPPSTIRISGFPYRLEANVAQPALSGGDIVRLRVSAATARINRGPWQPDLTVIAMQDATISASVSPLISARLEARSATASINWGEGRLRRQSTILQVATVQLGKNAMSISADTLELHLRERQGEPLPATSPVRETRGQLVLAGTRLRLSGGSALTMAAEILATGSRRLTGYDRWASGGTLELTRLSLADAHGEVLSARATLAPRGKDDLQIAGTLDTVCPQTVAAAFTTTSPQPERRLRVPVRLAFQGSIDALVLAPLPDLSRRPRRDQKPECPRLRQ